MDDKARTPSGGVRNLRAMFENRDNSEESTGSPQPNRGRSGAPEGARATHSPGPSKLAKVQTNFIAVDKPSKTGTTQWGLRINNNNSNTSDTNNGTTSTNNSATTTPNIEKNDPITIQKRKYTTVDDSSKKENTYTQDNIISPPSEPDMPRRRDSFSLHDDLPADHKTIQARKASIAEEFRNRAQSIQIGAAAEPIPEFAVETPALETPAVDGNRARHQLGYVEPPIPRTTANPDKQTNNNEPAVHMSPSDPKSENAVTDGRALQGASIRNLTGGDAKSMREAAVQGLKTTPAKVTLAMRPTPSSPAAQAREAQTGAPSNATKPLRSPPLEKSPASPAAAQRTAAASNRNVSSASTASAKPASKPASSTTNGATKPTTSTARSSATGPTASAAAKKTSAAASTSGAGFHKPKPKSPTRAAKLPSSLLAPTASSISKVAGVENNTTTQKRRESHGSLAQNKATAQSKLRGESLKHTTSHNRPSVGPPPSSAAHKKPTTSTTKPTGDSFLERMMRPTAASANKAVNHDTHPSPPKPAVAKSATPAHSRPVTREKVHAEKPEKKEDTPKKVAEEKTVVDKILEEKQADPNQQDLDPKPAERDELVEDPKLLEPRFSRPILEERFSDPISPKTETPPKTESPAPPKSESSPTPAGEVPPPKVEAPPVAESKEDAIKTEVPKTYQEPHQDPPMPSPKASLPSHTVPKVIKTERTISVTDMENSDGIIKKLPPGAIPIPKIAKKKKPSVESPKVPGSPKRNHSKPDVTDVPKEKKRDFLLEVREEEKRHRRMSERPSMVKNPTTIPEAAEEADEEIDDHQLHTPSPTMGASSFKAELSGGSEIPISTPKQASSPKKPLNPAKETAPPGLQPAERRERRDSITDNALQYEAISNSDVDDVDIALGAPSPSSQIKSQATGRRLSHVAEKAMDYAAQAVDGAAQKVDDALQHKISTSKKADKAEEQEAEAVQDFSKGHPLTSAMLNGSALDTDDEYTPTPSAEARGNPFDDLEGGKPKARRESKAGGGDFSIAPTFKDGEEKVAEGRQKGNAESKE